MKRHGDSYRETTGRCFRPITRHTNRLSGRIESTIFTKVLGTLFNNFQVLFRDCLTIFTAGVKTPLPTVVQDHGLFDNIQRVIFGSGLKFWLHRLLFLDCLSYLSHGQLSISLERLMLVDIDDIFVGEIGTRLQPDDVKALIATQERIRSMVPGFKFNLGFSGKYFHHGNDGEDEGDDLILKNVDKFMWFSHMWNHQQPHLYDNLTLLTEDMLLNKNFAKDKGTLSH